MYLICQDQLFSPAVPSMSGNEATAAELDDNEPIASQSTIAVVPSPGVVATPATQPPSPTRLRVVGTIERYIHCILPAVRYVPAVRPWTALRPAPGRVVIVRN